jgi:diguanylate cyclase (GGDEF)-like protein
MSQKVLAIDDSEEIHELLALWLASEGLQLRCAATAPEGLELARVTRPDLILLDIDLPERNGFEVCRELKRDDATASLPVIFLSGSNETVDKVKGLDLGAVDYVTKPFNPAELQARVRAALRTKRLHDLLAERAQIDGLTGLHNRAYFDRRLRTELETSLRRFLPLSLVMLDVDHFKKINDSCGHPFGDRVLQGVGELLSRAIDSDGTVCRYGGEEFGIIFPGTAHDLGRACAEVVRLAAEELTMVGPTGDVQITLSGGLACTDEWPADHPPTAIELLETADRALYVAKSMGRNRIVTFAAEMLSASRQ